MPGEIDVIRNVLELEKKKNFDNSAVAGGLSNFKSFIEKARNNSTISSELADTLSEVFSEYGSIGFEKRKRIH